MSTKSESITSPESAPLTSTATVVSIAEDYPIERTGEKPEKLFSDSQKVSGS